MPDLATGSDAGSMDQANRSREPSWRTLARVTGAAGLATIALVFVPALANSGSEPGFGGGADEVLAFFRSTGSAWDDFGAFTTTVGIVALLWFMVGLSTLLRDAEPEPRWRSSVASGSGIVLVALVLAGSWQAASFRAGDLDPQVARYAFDEGNVAFANGWVALGSFALCCGWVMVSTGCVRRLLGWWAIASGVGLVLSRAAWDREIWLLPYALFWLWVITVSVLLLRRGGLRRT